MYEPQDYICVDQVVDVHQCISITKVSITQPVRLTRFLNCICVDQV